jgi:6-phosphogluconate dehydrogenase (decarboxylating)
VHAGAPGAGHFVKLVHNGIEFGMLQALGEGMDLLERYREKLPTADILNCWRLPVGYGNEPEVAIANFLHEMLPDHPDVWAI